MRAFLLLFAFSILVVGASSSSSSSTSKLTSLPAFHNKIDGRFSDKRKSITLLSAFQEQQKRTILVFRGGAAAEDTEVESDDKKEEGRQRGERCCRHRT